MTWIDNIRKAYSAYFRETFDGLGLVEYENADGPGMGAFVKYQNDSFRLQVLNDRGILETDISPLFGEEQFKGIELFYSYLTLSTITPKSELEKRKILGTRLDYRSQMSFLTNNSNWLTTVLNKENFESTLKKIDELGHERINYNFK